VWWLAPWAKAGDAAGDASAAARAALAMKIFMDAVSFSLCRPHQENEVLQSLPQCTNLLVK
jgi:hypothetical protein